MTLSSTRRHNLGFSGARAEPDFGPDLTLEPVHLELRLAFEIERERMTGSVITTVRGNRPGARSLHLDAVGFRDVEIDGPERWRYDGRQIHLTWDQPFSAAESRTVHVRYTLESPISGMQFHYPDEAYPERPTFVCTDHETERARYWLPCVDYPSVRPTVDFFLTASSHLTILAGGTLQNERDHGDGTKTAHWRLDYPCPSYLCFLAIGKFSDYRDQSVDGIPIEYYAAEHIPPDWLKRTFAKTPAIMRWLMGRLGRPFPVPKHFQIALPDIDGAMENISLVTWDEPHLLDEQLEPELGLHTDSINIHEMAHSYFGNAVVCRHFEHSWLKESWATYMETVWREENLDPEEAHYDLHHHAECYFEEAETRYVRPIVTRNYDSSWDLFDAHLYSGGAWRLHMLRKLVGDEAFWAATRDYLGAFDRGLVETDDFRRKVEAHSGVNLVPFFEQWIHTKGYPKLKASLEQDEELDEVKLVIEQVQENQEKGIGLFRFHLDVEIEDEGGLRHLTLQIESKQTTALIPLRGKCQRIGIDRDSKALFALDFNPGDDILRNVLCGGGSVRGRIHAASELIKTGTRVNLRAVYAAMKRERFWGVRYAVATALGASGHAFAIAPLAELLRSELDPRVKRALAEACGKMRDGRLREALIDFLDAEQPPYARSAALESLGSQRCADDAARLERLVDDRGIHGLVASGALRGLAHLGRLDLLEARLPYGVQAEESRPAAVEAFGRAAARSNLDRRRHAADLLIDLTRDPDRRVRMKAGAALASLAIPSAIPALESLQRLEPKQDEPRIARWIATLSQGREVKEIEKLREQIEKLERRSRKMEEEIQLLSAG